MDNFTEKNLIDKWLKTNCLGKCPTFRAKISEESCKALKEKCKNRLDNYEYDNELMGAFLKICVNDCPGLKYD